MGNIGDVHDLVVGLFHKKTLLCADCEDLYWPMCLASMLSLYYSFTNWKGSDQTAMVLAD